MFLAEYRLFAHPFLSPFISAGCRNSSEERAGGAGPGLLQMGLSDSRASVSQPLAEDLDALRVKQAQRMDDGSFVQATTFLSESVWTSCA